MASFTLLILAVTLLASYARLTIAANDKPDVNDLRVTWGPPELWSMPQIFGKIPYKKDIAIAEGYTRVPEDSTCEGAFLGYRYNVSKSSIISIYDVNGNLAGIQTAVPKTLLYHDILRSWYHQAAVFQQGNIHGEDSYILTAYFIEPTTICTAGGTANREINVHIQTGPNPTKDFLVIPNDEKDLGSTPWTKGPCVPTMGTHYWYNITTDMDCDYFKPGFLLYDQGRFNGFGWAMMGYFDFSDRFEHPQKVIQGFMRPVPTCLNTLTDQIGGFTTQHIYLDGAPYTTVCEK